MLIKKLLKQIKHLIIIKSDFYPERLEKQKFLNTDRKDTTNIIYKKVTIKLPFYYWESSHRKIL